MCPSVNIVYAVDHIVAPSLSNNTRKICIWICAWNNYVSYTLVYVHFIVCSMYVSSCSTPSFSSPANSSPANSAIPYEHSPPRGRRHVRSGVTPAPTVHDADRSVEDGTENGRRATWPNTRTRLLFPVNLISSTSFGCCLTDSAKTVVLWERFTSEVRIYSLYLCQSSFFLGG